MTRKWKLRTSKVLNLIYWFNLSQCNLCVSWKEDEFESNESADRKSHRQWTGSSASQIDSHYRKRHCLIHSHTQTHTHSLSRVAKQWNRRRCGGRNALYWKQQYSLAIRTSMFANCAQFVADLFGSHELWDVQLRTASCWPSDRCCGPRRVSRAFSSYEACDALAIAHFAINLIRASLYCCYFLQINGAHSKWSLLIPFLIGLLAPIH